MSKSIEEEPKSEIAKKVMTPTRKYFVPSVGREVEADSVEEAIASIESEDEDEDEDNNETADDSER